MIVVGAALATGDELPSGEMQRAPRRSFATCSRRRPFLLLSGIRSGAKAVLPRQVHYDDGAHPRKSARPYFFVGIILIGSLK